MAQAIFRGSVSKIHQHVYEFATSSPTGSAGSAGLALGLGFAQSPFTVFAACL